MYAIRSYYVFMPPIMGAGGFIMAEMTEIPYVQIMLMAVFPAVIYFLSYNFV